MFVDYYALFEVPYNSSLSEIKIAYKKQAIKWHPDKNKQDTTQRMQLINEAKLILFDEEARRRYNVEYLKFKGAQKSKEYQKTSADNSTKFYNQTSSTYEYYEYNIQDDILAKWIQNARRQAKEIIKETIELSNVGGQAAFKEIKTGIGYWLIGLIILGILFALISLLN